MGGFILTSVECSGPPRRGRNLTERVMVRFPGLYRRLAALAQQRLVNPRSRLRREILRRGLVSGWAAFNRRDFELMLVRYAPDVEFEFDPGEQTLGLSGTFRGHNEMSEGLRALVEGWGQFELEPVHILDFGDRVLNFGYQHARGRASGMELEQEVSQLVTGREGLVTRDEHFFTWKEGLRAAGVDPDAVTLPSRGKAEQAASSAST